MDRIAIFHYGGYAGADCLMLQKPDGQQHIVDGQGLVSFLARQKSLQLVFINGCSSKRQPEECRDMGVAAVIGTSEPINEAAVHINHSLFQRLETVWEIVVSNSNSLLATNKVLAVCILLKYQRFASR
ncbi:MAG: hypothetical protein AB8H47_24455 [Bacteroidia bacterium]